MGPHPTHLHSRRKHPTTPSTDKKFNLFQYLLSTFKEIKKDRILHCFTPHGECRLKKVRKKQGMERNIKERKEGRTRCSSVVFVEHKVVRRH
ncbi:hypothetical protein CEXT_24061 [Caerostris extrusa]|uniref:Uncharacterized protein n=1 Tax=Caerostris extrusa TaxID=172846 RepID=A0AAV4SIS3_CAEEX|nr:hypothetical protein CEXT_24061 [Caerostris extrusa]